jgi:lipid-binding SYLF domain-containing protein
MHLTKTLAACAAVALLLAGTASADDRAADCAKTVELFRNAGESGKFFAKSYGYAVYPTIGKGGLGVGGAFGKGCVYAGGRHVGESSMSQLSVGFQAGGQGYSQIVFLQDRRAFEEFTNGNFEFGAGVGAVAITAAAGAQATTGGSGASASAGKKDAATAGEFVKGYAIFTIAKGGLMYEATLAGQKYSYKPLGAKQ